MGDKIETLAIKRCFGEHATSWRCPRRKSMTGHLLGAAGGLEAGITTLAVYHQVVPPTINLDEPDRECDLDYVPNDKRAMPITMPCRTRSASAAPMRRCCSSDTRIDHAFRLQISDCRLQSDAQSEDLAI